MERLDQGSLHTLVKQPAKYEYYPDGIRSPDPTITERAIYQRAIETAYTQ